MNLTTVKPGAEMVLRHYGESLFFAAHLPAAQEKISILDLGSGAGFPGLPLSILKPDWHVTLVEANQRKAVFLREASRYLENVSVLAERIEKVKVPVDWLVARAVNPKEILRAMPSLAPRMGLMIGEDDFSSIRTDAHVVWEQPIQLPWGDRRICVYGRSFHGKPDSGKF